MISYVIWHFVITEKWQGLICQDTDRNAKSLTDWTVWVLRFTTNLKSSGSQSKSCYPKWRSEQVKIIDWRIFHFWYYENRFHLTRYSISDRHYFEVRILHIACILCPFTSIKQIIFKYPSMFKYLLFWNPIRETYLHRWSLIQIVNTVHEMTNTLLTESSFLL